MERLIEIGRQTPGRTLYPTSDDTAFLFALRSNELQRFYRTYQPPLETVYTLLNKKRLYALGRDAGLESPQTWYPTSDAEVGRIARLCRFPLLLKPQTQIQFASHIKGFRVPGKEQLRAAYRAFTGRSRFGREVLRYDPGVATPMIQRFHTEASEEIYSIAGFVDASGRYAARAARKILQRPRALGVGVCFQAAPVRHDLLQKILRICEISGYHGVFEVEFIKVAGRDLLIDFNPRFYGQMAFEIARGLPLARLVYEASAGNGRWVQRALEAAGTSACGGPEAFCHGLAFDLLLSFPGASRRMSRGDRHRWLAWAAQHRGGAIDAVDSADDPGPAMLDRLNELLAAARHPRAFLHSLALHRS